MISKKLKIFAIASAILILSACGGGSTANTSGTPAAGGTAASSEPSIIPVSEKAKTIYEPNSDAKKNETESAPGKSGEGNKTTASNAFISEKVKKGDKVGAFVVSDVKRDNSNITVRFSGKVTVSGSYNSDSSKMLGEFISLNPDEKSSKKIPCLTETGSQEFVLDPNFQKDMDFTKLFGKTGTIGKFEIELSEFVVTDYPDFFKRVGKLDKVIKITNNNKK